MTTQTKNRLARISDHVSFYGTKVDGIVIGSVKSENAIILSIDTAKELIEALQEHLKKIQQ